MGRDKSWGSVPDDPYSLPKAYPLAEGNREAIRSPERSEPRRGRKGPSDADEILERNELMAR